MDDSGGKVESKAVNGIKYDVDIGPLMIDKNISQKPVKFYATTRFLQGLTGKPSGWLNEKQLFIRPALFSEVDIWINTKDLLKKIPVSKTAAGSAPASAQPAAIGNPVTTQSNKMNEDSGGSAATIDVTHTLEKNRALVDALAKIDNIQVTFTCEGIGLAGRGTKS